MFRPYNDLEDSDGSSTSGSSIDTGADTDHSGETDGTSDADRITHDGHMQAMDQWREHAMSWINGPGRTPVVEGPGPSSSSPVNGISHQNTTLQITEQRITHMLMVDSLDRDQRIYPYPTQFKLRLPRTYRNVARIDIVQVKMLCGFYNISEAKGNHTFTLEESAEGGTVGVTITDGTYGLQQLIDEIDAQISEYGYAISYDCITGRITISAGFAFSIQFGSAGEAADWGLGWNLGFGGPAATVTATDCSGGTLYCATATCFPRLTTDYIYLRLNEPEFMNTVDHTDLEDTAVSQDPTGQIAHYFGKLLLNDFGCYAQTFIESPKVFAPVLGRLDRLSFTWVDRYGNPFVGPDALSCDWNMALRVVEIQDRADASSTLIRAPDSSSALKSSPPGR